MTLANHRSAEEIGRTERGPRNLPPLGEPRAGQEPQVVDTVREYFDHVTLLNVSVVASGPMETAFSPESVTRCLAAIWAAASAGSAAATLTWTQTPSTCASFLTHWSAAACTAPAISVAAATASFT